MVMAFIRSLNVILLIIFLPLILSSVEGLNIFDPNALDAFFQHHASKSLVKPHTGTLYKISLPVNFSGMEVSTVRLRSGSFWLRGSNFSSFRFPPRIIPTPYTKRLAIVYENLGNWSSLYYEVPGHSLATPVIGFMVYDASNSRRRGDMRLKLNFFGDPISVQFPRITQPDKNVTLKCATFGAGGSVELRNMTTPNMCFATTQGHFAVVIPSPRKKERPWKLWVIGFAAGLGGLALLGLVGTAIFKTVSRKRMENMERRAEQGVVLDTMWIGRSKMPSATMVRTQPTLENEDVP